MELPGLMAVLDCRVESISRYVIQQTFRDASKCITELEADNKRLRELVQQHTDGLITLSELHDFALVAKGE